MKLKGKLTGAEDIKRLNALKAKKQKKIALSRKAVKALTRTVKNVALVGGGAALGQQMGKKPSLRWQRK